MTVEFIYLLIHGVSTLLALVTFFIRIEHRITRLETKMENFESRFK
jgi:hypothetical protein